MGENKVTLEVAGRPLLLTAVRAVAGSVRTVLVGPQATIIQAMGPALEADPALVQTQEDPPYGGPVAGIAAGLEELRDVKVPLVAVLACDIPGAPQAVEKILSSSRLAELPQSLDFDGVCALAKDGYPQWLLAFYRLDYLRRRVRVAGQHGGSVRRLLEGARLAGVPMPEHYLQDVDSPGDLARYLKVSSQEAGMVGTEKADGPSPGRACTGLGPSVQDS